MQANDPAGQPLRGIPSIDPHIALALAVGSNPGVYAALIGSGVSRAASILTGDEVVRDLLGQVAKLKGVAGKNAEEWLLNEFGPSPSYSQLLSVLARRPPERQALLSKYFEPTEEERERNEKTPTRAHKALAELVRDGYIRVIVTTNFDRLMETALEALGIVPSVVASPSQARGAPPLVHTKCLVLKLHGDYVSGSLLNTEEELSLYDRSVSRLLTQILDDFGLIVSGWSGEWDNALRNAIEQSRSRRYTTFWGVRSQASAVASGIVKHRSATVVHGDADTLFTGLAERVKALASAGRRHPISKVIAIESVKRYIVDARHRILLRDLVAQEAEVTLAAVSDIRSSARSQQPCDDALSATLDRYHDATHVASGILVAGCHWSEREHADLWVKLLERVATHAEQGGGVLIWLQLEWYPVSHLLHAAALSALVAEKYWLLQHLLLKTQVWKQYKQHTAGLVLSTDSILKVIQDPYQRGQYTRQSLRMPFRDYLPDDDQFHRAFDRYEYLRAMICGDANDAAIRDLHVIASRAADSGADGIGPVIAREIEGQGDNWPPIRDGLFAGSLVRAKDAKQRVDEWIVRRG